MDIIVLAVIAFVILFSITTFFSVKKLLKEQKAKKAKTEKELKEKEKAKEEQKKTEQKKEGFIEEVLKQLKKKNEQKVEQEVVAEIKEKELFEEEKKTSLDDLELKDLKFEKENTKEEQEFMQKYREDKYKDKPDFSDVFEGFDAIDTSNDNYIMSEIFEQEKTEPKKEKSILDDLIGSRNVKTVKKKESIKTQMKNLSKEMQAIQMLDLLKEKV